MILETVDIPNPLVEITEMKDNMIEQYLVYSPKVSFPEAVKIACAYTDTVVGLLLPGGA